MLPVVQIAAWDWEPPHMSGYHYTRTFPPRHHSTLPLMPTVHPSTRTTKTRSGAPIRRCPPPPLPHHGAPPFGTSEPPEIQPKALLGPFTDVGAWAAAEPTRSYVLHCGFQCVVWTE